MGSGKLLLRILERGEGFFPTDSLAASTYLGTGAGSTGGASGGEANVGAGAVVCGDAGFGGVGVFGEVVFEAALRSGTFAGASPLFLSWAPLVSVGAALSATEACSAAVVEPKV
jgi:hypothetical protein